MLDTFRGSVRRLEVTNLFIRRRDMADPADSVFDKDLLSPVAMEACATPCIMDGSIVVPGVITD